MKLYYIVPPKGVTYNASALAQLDFEAGMVFRCTGTIDIDAAGRVTILEKFAEPIPMRYSECDHHYIGGELVSSVSRKFCLAWKTGRTVMLQNKATGSQRSVGIEWGSGKGTALQADPRTTDGGERFRAFREVRRDQAVLRNQVAKHGSWVTSSGQMVRPFRLNERPDLLRFPYMVYGERLDPSQGSGAGDREVQRWYLAAMREAYNPYAKRLERTISGTLNTSNGNTFTAVAPDPDTIHVKPVKDVEDHIGYDMTPNKLRFRE